jgi:potassium-transporting ATPase KdpC subunit
MDTQPTLWSHLSPAVRLLGALTLLTGLIYPLAVTGIAAVAFPGGARGSLIERDGRVVGSEWIGQPFEEPGYFWSRPSATSRPFDGGASSGSNLGPTHPALAAQVTARIERLRAADPGSAGQPVPIDLVTASGSGLDPHISPAGAIYQIRRVARSRGLDESSVRALVERAIEGRTFGVLGEPRVNVLRLNLALDALAGRPRRAEAGAP